MQTRLTVTSVRQHTLKRTVAAVIGTLMLCSLSACNAPYLAQDESSTTVNTCENAAKAAHLETSESASGFPLLRRYLALEAAADSWSAVAVHCPTQFAQGTMENAQARFRRAQMGRMLGMAGDASAQDLATSQTLESLSESHDGGIAPALSTMAEAEDRAGFAVQVLAARNAPNATLALSDNHKAVASSLVSLGSVSPDPRKKVYPVTTLIAQPVEATDNATGLSEPTMAVIEMDCARASATALADSSQAGSSNEVRALSALVSSRAYLAFALGYPSYDAAVYE